MRNPAFLSLLARSFLAGEATVDQIVARCIPPSDRPPWRWLRPLAKKFVKRFGAGARPREQEVIEFLRRNPGVRHVSRVYGKKWSIAKWLNEPQRMQPVAAARGWNLLSIESVSALAQWFDLSVEELEWFADLKGLNHRSASPQLTHYKYRVLTKSSGTIRLIEAPKSRLKKFQQQILSSILDKVPPHPSVHGFVKGRSIKSSVESHVAQRVILRMDLQDFFPSFSARRVQTMFRTLGYPERVADLLGGICTNFTPQAIWSREGFDPPLALQVRQWARDLYCRPHLPQGAPTSPAIANVCFYRVDCRLAGLAAASGATYTRYADDLAFSGDRSFERGVERFSTHVAATLLEEGFHVNHRKTRIMRQAVRQHVVGLVANRHTNVIRADFDRLKATLTNCVRFNPESQNRNHHPQFRAHLEGRVAFVESINPARGGKLRNILDRILWT